jgi:hypothetical protein
MLDLKSVAVLSLSNTKVIPDDVEPPKGADT